MFCFNFRWPHIKRQDSRQLVTTPSPCRAKSQFSWFENNIDEFHAKNSYDQTLSNDQVREFVWFEDENKKKVKHVVKNHEEGFQFDDCNEEKENGGKNEIQNTMRKIYESNFGLIKKKNV